MQNYIKHVNNKLGIHQITVCEDLTGFKPTFNL